MNDFINVFEKSSVAPERPALARLPQVQRLMECELAEALCAVRRRDHVVQAVRAELDRVRRAVLDGQSVAPDFFPAGFFARVGEVLERRHGPSLVRVINATGIVLHTNLGRAPLAPEALAAVAEAGRAYSNLEFDLEQGERGSRHAHVEALLCRITGAEAALVVNNCAAAVLLSLSALGAGGDVLVSRGELIEIGGAFRMPDVIAQSGARLVEVGTTNKTRLSDYEQAVSENTRLVLKSHPSNYRVVGFSASVPRAELAALARRRGLLFLEDLGSGALVDLRQFGLAYEPTVQECVQAGAHLVAFSGDKLLGGPQAGIVVGSRSEIDRLKKHPLQRALRIDKLSLAALEATLRLYESPSGPESRVPVLRMLTQQQAALRRRCQRLARSLRQIPGLDCRVESGTALAGGGSLPEAPFPTCVLRLRTASIPVHALSQRLRRQRPALIARLADDSLLLDLRTVGDDEQRDIPRLLAEALNR